MLMEDSGVGTSYLETWPHYLVIKVHCESNAFGPTHRVQKSKCKCDDALYL
jgi:hypothetical protein